MSPPETGGSSAREIAARVRRGELSAEEVTREALDRIARKDNELGAFLHVMWDEAPRRARALDQERARGEPLGPLAGVPVAVKDNLCVQGAPCTCASRILDGYQPPYDATVVTRLLAAGAVIVGKTNLDEFAMGSSTENSAFRRTVNPWDATRVPGGSSGGSAVAVAADMVPLALGSDTGGSVRLPAAFCGVAALKPTYGRLSRFGLVAFASSLDQVGPLARGAADLAHLFGAVAGPDRRDSSSRAEPPAEAEPVADVRDRIIAFPEKVLDHPGVAPEVAEATRAAARTFERLGARIETIDFPDLDAGIAAYYLVCTAEASSNLARFDGIRYGRRAPVADLDGLYAASRSAGFGPEVKRRILLGTYALSSGYYEAYYGRAMKARQALKARFREIFDRADILLLPTSPTEAFRLGERTADPLAMYLADLFTVFANLIGAPALSIPAGFSPAGLPLGIQLVAGDLGESLLFNAALAFESVTDFHTRRAAPAGEPA